MFVGIDNPYNRTIGWRFVTFERERSLFASAPKDEFANTCTDSIECDHRTSFRFQIGIKGLHNKKSSPFASDSFLIVETTVPITRAICILSADSFIICKTDR